ncbi:MAG TPA: FKBP-type peptidyl-prolyl cis-trans isomerase [Ferruginibacter sp.]|nr:FKBP-type peptidyl-prolyl cis-trans isomerase [Ferruginibacter sp.]
MKQLFYLSAVCMLVLTACTGSFKKGDKGLEYKIFNTGSGKTVGYGNYMQIHIKQVYGGTKDTVLMDTRDYMSRIQVLDSISAPLAYFKILKQLKKGDSLIIRLLTDSAFKDAKQEMPPFMKKGKYLYTHVTLVNFFETKEQADSANKAESVLAKPRIYKKQLEEVEKELAGKKAQIDIDSKLIEDYLAKNNIKAQKTKWGTYVAILTEGTGEKMDSRYIATVNYTGRTLDSGFVFDSNTDPAFNHMQPYPVNLAELGGVILGWSDALQQMKKGTKATIFIPSSLGYGENGNGDKIKPNAILIFDMDIVDAATEEEYLAKQQQMQEEMLRKSSELSDPKNKDTKQPEKK